jgi:hypothetical protein
VWLTALAPLFEPAKREGEANVAATPLHVCQKFTPTLGEFSPWKHKNAFLYFLYIFFLFEFLLISKNFFPDYRWLELNQLELNRLQSSIAED